jgi:hypothetical protein
MATVLQDRLIDFEGTGTRTTVPTEPVSHLMYYLSCIASATGLQIPPHLIDNQRAQYLSSADLTSLILFAAGVPPDILIAAHIFILDEDRSICTSSSNRFFEITDREVAAVACSETVITGERVSVTKIMMCTPEFLKTYYYQPMSILRDLIQVHSNKSEGCQCCSGCVSSFFLYGFPLNSEFTRKRILAWNTLIFMVLSLIWLIGLGYCYSLIWIEVSLIMLHLFMAAVVLTIIGIYFAGAVVDKPLRICQWWFCFVILVSSLGVTGGSFTLATLKVTYFDALKEVCLIWSNPNLREKIENHFECSGWGGSQFDLKIDSPDIQLCSDVVMPQVGGFVYILGTGYLFMGLGSFWILAMTIFSRSLREEGDDS